MMNKPRAEGLLINTRWDVVIIIWTRFDHKLFKTRLRKEGGEGGGVKAKTCMTSQGRTARQQAVPDWPPTVCVLHAIHVLSAKATINTNLPF